MTADGVVRPDRRFGEHTWCKTGPVHVDNMRLPVPQDEGHPMKRRHTCGHPITGGARELVPESVSGVRPTVYVHRTRTDRTAVERARS